MSLHYLVKCLCTNIAQLWNWVKRLPCKTQPFETYAKHIHPMMLPSFGALSKRESQWPPPPKKNTEWLTVCILGNKEERQCKNTPAQRRRFVASSFFFVAAYAYSRPFCGFSGGHHWGCARDQHWVSHWWHQSTRQKWSIMHHFDTCQSRARSVKPIILMWCWHNSSAGHMSNIWRVYLSAGQFCSAQGAWGNQLSCL